MHNLLAYAETADSGMLNLTKALGGLGIVAGVALLSAIVIGISRSRGHRQADGIMAATIFWAMITAGSIIYGAAAQTNWSKEYTARIESGYYDPRDTSDKPKMPWVQWSGLGVAYAGLLAWSISRKSAVFGKGEPQAGGADQ
jgi:hypothetical protein